MREGGGSRFSGWYRDAHRCRSSVVASLNPWRVRGRSPVPASTARIGTRRFEYHSAPSKSVTCSPSHRLDERQRPLRTEGPRSSIQCRLVLRAEAGELDVAVRRAEAELVEADRELLVKRGGGQVEDHLAVDRRVGTDVLEEQRILARAHRSNRAVIVRLVLLAVGGLEGDRVVGKRDRVALGRADLEIHDDERAVGLLAQAVLHIADAAGGLDVGDVPVEGVDAHAASHRDVRRAVIRGADAAGGLLLDLLVLLRRRRRRARAGRAVAGLARARRAATSGGADDGEDDQADEGDAAPLHELTDLAQLVLPLGTCGSVPLLRPYREAIV